MELVLRLLFMIAGFNAISIVALVAHYVRERRSMDARFERTIELEHWVETQANRNSIVG